MHPALVQADMFGAWWTSDGYFTSSKTLSMKDRNKFSTHLKSYRVETFSRTECIEGAVDGCSNGPLFQKQNFADTSLKSYICREIRMIKVC